MNVRFYIISNTPLLHQTSTHSWSWALPEKPPIVQLLKNSTAFYGTRRFIAIFTRAVHWSLSCNSINTIPSYISKIYFNIVHLPTSWSSQWAFPSRFPTKIPYAHLFSPIVLHALPLSSSLTWLCTMSNRFYVARYLKNRQKSEY
jgi:hypothetical protein